MIRYVESAAGVAPEQLVGFFEGWREKPDPGTHLRLLRGSDHVVVAIDESGERVIGFITAITDGTLAAYIPLLEVLPAYRRQGIGRALLSRMLRRLEGFYMVDLVCDAGRQPFYARAGMQPANGMMIRRYELQSGMRARKGDNEN